MSCCYYAQDYGALYLFYACAQKRGAFRLTKKGFMKHNGCNRHSAGRVQTGLRGRPSVWEDGKWCRKEKEKEKENCRSLG